MTEQRKGDWMQTYTGRAYWPADPRPEDVDHIDIAHALSHLCRFGGHTDRFYSVAEHSVYVSLEVPEEHALCALMHDATEAYVIDVPRPLKHMLQGYAEIEAKNWAVIAERFGLPLEMPPCVKDADNRVLLAERDELLQEPPIPWAWARELVPAQRKIEALPPVWAKRMFLRRFMELTTKVAA